ncbi:glutaminase A [Oricola sp.]|uniref:glutaminase A n=1 Tax=Oricola sp. TaxID=1979950 RepID=UPI0025D71E26|nr:glutaminase A [Oricola sp.]MCI5077094.1 glutaminase A [Oricola sp.]
MASAVSPISDYLATLYKTLHNNTQGEIATYIPELGLADPSSFGICIATVDGQVYTAGDVDIRFTIQSMSKPFIYGYALQQHGQEKVQKKVGVEPTGESFNSIVLDELTNRPFNPMVNAGAIAVTELVEGDTPERRLTEMVDWFSRFAGRELDIDESVFRSEQATGHRNRAIAYMMLNTGMLERDPEDVLDLYFRQCSLSVDCKDMAVMAATLAAQGVNPLTRERVLAVDNVRDVLTVMSTCGMYDYAGQWAYDVGFPAKSGVSGGVIAVIPGQLGVAVYSPPLDRVGNSVRGVEACKKLSHDFSLHLFDGRTDVHSVIRREYTGAVPSKRVRSAAEREFLAKFGERLNVIEVQGALFFGSAENFLRRLTEIAQDGKTIVVDMKRVAYADRTAIELICQTARALSGRNCELIFTELSENPELERLRRALDERVCPETGFSRLDDTDIAIEQFEDAILEEAEMRRNDRIIPLDEIDIFNGLSSDDLRTLSAAVTTFQFDAGQKIINEGDDARIFFVVGRGSVSIWVNVDGRRPRRIGSVGQGGPFGEMALLDGGKRSADVIADVPVICYGFSVDGIREISVDSPTIMTTILGNLVRIMSDRLRLANDEIRALQ